VIEAALILHLMGTEAFSAGLHIPGHRRLRCWLCGVYQAVTPAGLCWVCDSSPGAWAEVPDPWETGSWAWH
jgi:hypothetical protein